MECDHRLQRILLSAINIVDFSVICGFRGKEDQHKAFVNKKSKLDWPNSKHNKYIMEIQEDGGKLIIPQSEAVDIIPWPFKDPIDWKDTQRFAHVMGVIKAEAYHLGIPVRFGFDWDGDTNWKEHPFNDWPHFEITV